MQAIQSMSSGASRLRCVFSDAVMSFNLGDHPTLGDIAEMLNEPGLSRRGMPLAIDIAWLGRTAARTDPRVPLML